MTNLSTPDGPTTPALHEAHEAAVTATHSLPPRPSSSPAVAKPEARCCHASASGPVRASAAAGTAGAAAPLGSGPLFHRPPLFAAGLPERSCVRTEDGTVILLDRVTGRVVSARDRGAAEAMLPRGAEPPGRREQPDRG